LYCFWLAVATATLETLLFALLWASENTYLNLYVLVRRGQRRTGSTNPNHAPKRAGKEPQHTRCSEESGKWPTPPTKAEEEPPPTPYSYRAGRDSRRTPTRTAPPCKCVWVCIHST
jgi:hypothetical protein